MVISILTYPISYPSSYPAEMCVTKRIRLFRLFHDEHWLVYVFKSLCLCAAVYEDCVCSVHCGGACLGIVFLVRCCVLYLCSRYWITILHGPSLGHLVVLKSSTAVCQLSDSCHLQLA